MCIRDRFTAVQWLRFRRVDLAKIAAPGAVRPTDEKCRLARFPTLMNVGTSRLLAHRVQRGPFDLALHVLILRTCFHGVADPPRFRFDRCLRITFFNSQEFAAFRCYSHAPYRNRVIWGVCSRFLTDPVPSRNCDPPPLIVLPGRARVRR